ncbi:hypothetical protein QJS10_CPB14g01146 [Acorus calamus]|uniref:Uncharacterized protein n=1 Tax=Acorus calamus TaxID=4465 RepID=A0AAV9DFI3_ACOCL|nr:hypothetical protein QJS10_CPB14g01146 [Acorus calamus]
MREIILDALDMRWRLTSALVARNDLFVVEGVHRRTDHTLKIKIFLEVQSANLIRKLAFMQKSKLRSRHKKVKAYDLSSLSEFLPSLDALRKPSRPTEFKLNSKSRKKLVVKEARQLKAVLNNETFKLDSLAAIHQHLQATQPVEEVSRQKKTVKTVKKKRTTKSSAAQSMEFRAFRSCEVQMID